MKKLAPSLLVVAAALVLASGAFAGGSIKTTVVFDTAGPLSDNPAMESIDGHLTSPSDKCLNNRTVKIKGIYGFNGGATTRPFDTAQTGKNGGFSGIGPESSGGNEIDSASLKLSPKSIGPKKHPKTCSGDTLLAVVAGA